MHARQVLGGYIADYAAAQDPDRGRIKTAICSVGAGIPLALVLLNMLPCATAAATMHGVVLFILGGVCSWCGAINSSLFCDIVPPRLRASVFALDCAIEGGIAAFAAPIMGRLTEAFGYKILPTLASSSSGGVAVTAEAIAALRAENVAALGCAMSWCITVPWLVCLATFVFLHERKYYAADRDAVNAAEAALDHAVYASADGPKHRDDKGELSKSKLDADVALSHKQAMLGTMLTLALTATVVHKYYSASMGT